MPLRRIVPRSDVRQLGYLRLWRDDLAEMTRIIGLACAKVLIFADDYELSELDDLEELVRADQMRLTNFRVVGEQPMLHLELSPIESKIEAEEPGLAVLGAIQQIEEIARRRERRFAKRWSDAVSRGIRISGFTFQCPRFTRVVLLTQSQRDAPTYWQRKRGDVLIHVVVGTFFFVLGIIAGKLTS